MVLTTPTLAGVDPAAPLGGHGAKEHDDLVSWFVQVNNQLELNCQNLYREAVSFAGLYLGNIRDPRKKHEMWRSNLHIPYGASAIDTAAPTASPNATARSIPSASMVSITARA